jgi:transposase
MQIGRTQKYEQMRTLLNEKQWRQFLALEAQERGNIAQVAREAGVSKNTIRHGIREVEAGEVYSPGARVRKGGGGRKKVVETDRTLLADLEGLLDPKGDPMSHLQWTTKSVAHLKKALHEFGHRLGDTAIRRLLHARGFSLRANKKRLEGESHPDRDQQFEHINRQCRQFEEQGNPIISVDCKN